jgi:hypothetical protein
MVDCKDTFGHIPTDPKELMALNTAFSPPLAAIIDDNERNDDALHEMELSLWISPCVAWVDWWAVES